MKSISEIQKEMAEFVRERNWEQFHTPKDLAISISLEASELLEIFQWSGADLEVNAKKNDIADELADIMMCCFSMAEAEGFDIEEIIENKLEKTKRKYPVEKAYGNSKKYTEL